MQNSLYDKMRGLENDFANRIKDQRDAQAQIIRNLEEEKTRMAKNGSMATEDNTHMLRSLLSTIERKVDEEVSNRHRDLGEAKDALE